MSKIRLKELREDKGISQTQLAREIGIDQRTISNYEIGKTEPNIQAIKIFCDYFEVTAGYLLGLED